MPNGGNAKRRRCRTTEVPNDEGAKLRQRRRCQTARRPEVPAYAKGGGQAASTAVQTARRECRRQVATATAVQRAVSRRLSIPPLTPFGIFAVWYFRPLALPPFGTPAVSARPLPFALSIRQPYFHEIVIEHRSSSHVRLALRRGLVGVRSVGRVLPPPDRRCPHHARSNRVLHSRDRRERAAIVVD